MKKLNTFEPNGMFDRALYAVMALTLPHAIFSTWDRPGLEFATVVCVAWWVLATYWTIRLTISSYRRWRSVPRSES